MKISKKDEVHILSAVEKINQKIAFYKTKYSVSNELDLMIMAAIEIASEYQKELDFADQKNQDNIDTEMKQVHILLDNVLTNLDENIE